MAWALLCFNYISKNEVENINIKKILDNSTKILMCLVVAFTFMFVQPREHMKRANAIVFLAPAAAPIVSAVGGVVARQLVATGVKFVSKQALKNTSKQIAKNVAKRIDPKDIVLEKKGNGTKWKMPSYVKGLVGLGLDDVIEKSIGEFAERKEYYNDDKYELDPGTGKKIYKQYERIGEGMFNDFSPKFLGVYPIGSDNMDLKFADYVKTLPYDLIFEPVAYSNYMSVILDFDNRVEESPATPVFLKTDVWEQGSISFNVSGFNASRVQIMIMENNTGKHLGNVFLSTYSDSYKAFDYKLKELAKGNQIIYTNEGAYFPEVAKDYIKIDKDFDDDSVDWKKVVKNMESELPDFYKGEVDIDIDLTNYDIDLSMYAEGDQIQDHTIFNDIDLSVAEENVYNNFPTTIYNYASPVVNPNVVVENNIIIDNGGVTVPDDDDDDGSGNGVVIDGGIDVSVELDGLKHCVDDGELVPCKDVEAIDGSLLAYLKNAYDYATNAVKVSVDGLNSIVTGSAGLIALYSNIFDWLPTEMTVILTSGLLLMIGLRVFRK